jgi:oligoendopeptidase F
MFDRLPQTALDLLDWSWSQIEPYFRDLENRPLTAETVEQWLLDWSRLEDLITEGARRLYIATTRDTSDRALSDRYHTYLSDINEPARHAEQRLREKLLASGLNVPGFEIPLRNMRSDASLFHEANVPLLTEERKLINTYEHLVGSQTIRWEGEERTPYQMRRVYLDPDRARRERAWRQVVERQLLDRERINTLWTHFLRLRTRLAHQAGYPDFRAYQWDVMRRFDYTPADCETFHEAIEAVVVPAAARIYAHRRQRMGLATLRPWDLDVDPLGREPLHPFHEVADLIARCETIFGHVDPRFAEDFAVLRREGMLDLDNRKHKAGGGYQEELPAARLPFIFMNAVGIHDDVQTLLHEGGHAFHSFEMAALPYSHQRDLGMEIAEVASMTMELLAAPYLTEDYGGFYTPAQARRARTAHLEEMILFWPYMAVVDAFQHWAYTHVEEAIQPGASEARWSALYRRFLPDEDFTGLEDALAIRWHRLPHPFDSPFYYVEYGLAQMGAVQIWRNSMDDAPRAIQQYRHMLALGGTRTLPELYAAGGARFAFDAETLQTCVSVIEAELARLESAQ